MNTPINEVPRAEREAAIKAARSQACERYYRLTEELSAQKELIRNCDQQLVVMGGLELPTADGSN